MTKFKSRIQPTFKFFYIGAVIITVGICAFSVNILGAILLIVFGIFLLMSLSSVVVDVDASRIKTFYLFLFFKVGRWQSLKKFTHLVIGPNSSSQMIGRTSTKFRTDSYSVSILSQENKLFELAEFTDIEKAQKFLKEASNQIGLPIIDKIEIMKQRAKSERAKRR